MKFVNILACMFALALTACGGGGGSGGNDSGNSKYSLSLDVSNLSFNKMSTDSSVVTKEVNVTFKGDGVVVGYPPGIEQPDWLTVNVISSTQSSAKIAINVVGGVMFNPGTYNTTIRFITGHQSGSPIVYKDLAVSMIVDEPFNVTANDELDFWLVGDDASQVMPGAYTLNIRGGASDWDISSSASWLQFSKTIGKGIANVSVQINPAMVPETNSQTEIEVKDKTTGESKIFTVNFDRQSQNDGVAVNDSQPFIFQFEIGDLLIDTVNQKLYAIDPVARRLYIVNLTNGLTEKYFDFEMLPHSLAITPDAKKLYVSLLTKENSPYYWTEEQAARIAIMDTTQVAITNQLRLDVSPGDIAVTSDNQLIVGGGSDQHVYFYFYNAVTGTLLKKSQNTYSPVTHMSLLPSEKSFYYSVSWQAPPPVYRFDLDVEAITDTRVPAPHGDWTSPVDFWINPEGTYGVTTEGDVFKTDDTSYVTRMTTDYIYIKTAAFDPLNNRLLIVNTSDKSENRGHQQLVEYDPVTWELRSVLAEPFTDFDRLLYVNNEIQVLKKNEEGYVLEPLDL